MRTIILTTLDKVPMRSQVMLFLDNGSKVGGRKIDEGIIAPHEYQSTWAIFVNEKCACKLLSYENGKVDSTVH